MHRREESVVKAKDLEAVLQIVEETVSSSDTYPEDFPERLSQRVAGAPGWLTVEVDRAVQNLLAKLKHRKGKFLVVTGVDKAGKETHSFNPKHHPEIISLSDTLSSRGLKVMKILQP